jgi:hypothetical protein
MRYNKLSFDIQFRRKTSDGDEVSLEVRVTVNPTTLPDILDVHELLAALVTRGRYPLFTCVCGDFGCNGCYVDVECRDQAWSLHNRYDPLDPDILLEEMHYDINWSQLEKLVLDLSEAIQRFQQEYPNTVIGVGEMGTVLPTQDKVEAALQAIREHIHAGAA